jgi:hypothetical protein
MTFSTESCSRRSRVGSWIGGRKSGLVVDGKVWKIIALDITFCSPGSTKVYLGFDDSRILMRLTSDEYLEIRCT